MVTPFQAAGRPRSHLHGRHFTWSICALKRISARPWTTDWGEIRAPALVASGAHDFLWPPPIGRQVAGLVPGARFAVPEDAGHFPPLQAPRSTSRLSGQTQIQTGGAVSHRDCFAAGAMTR
jgi:pimeloyl-ACP methyl ester carboxylesterase